MSQATQELKSIKITEDDYRQVELIRADRGLKLIDAIGVALHGWEMIPRKKQDQVVRERIARRNRATAVA